MVLIRFLTAIKLSLMVESLCNLPTSAFYMQCWGRPCPQQAQCAKSNLVNKFHASSPKNRAVPCPLSPDKPHRPFLKVKKTEFITCAQLMFNICLQGLFLRIHLHGFVQHPSLFFPNTVSSSLFRILKLYPSVRKANPFSHFASGENRLAVIFPHSDKPFNSPCSYIIFILVCWAFENDTLKDFATKVTRD